MLAAFDGDQIVGCVGAERTWHVSPLWVARETRGNGLALHLATEIKKYNTEGFAEMLVTTNPHVETLVHRIGFLPIPGVIWRRK
jgi:citrate lyase synthetase